MGLVQRLAQDINLVPTGGIGADISGYSIGDIIAGLIMLILVIAAIVFFFMLLWGGIQYITSGGDKGKTEEARGRITAALIGLVIVFAAWAIAQLLETFFGITLLQLNIPTIGGVS